MKSALMSTACALGIVSFTIVGCSRKTNDREQPQGQAPSATEQPQTEQQPTDEQRKAEQQRKEAEQRSIGGGPTETTAPSTALSHIVAARCDREVRCNNVGADKKYKTRAECVAEMQKDKHDDFSVAACPAVNQKKLGDCVKELHEERCGSLIDPFNRMEMCRSSALCVQK